MQRKAGLAIGALALLLVAGCASTPANGRPVQVVTGFYPLQFVAERVGGERAAVTSLAQPGAEPHDLELRPRQVASIARADLVLYLDAFQPAVDEAVALDAADRALDVKDVVPVLAHVEDEHDHQPGAADPHLWLDPTRLARVADAVANRLTQLDPAGAAGYQRRATTLQGQLSMLDQEYRTGLTGCARREIVVSHAAFAYLGERYGLDQVALGLTPEGEPTPQRLAEVARAARQHGATTIFFESLASPRVAEAIAAEVGASTAVLDPIEGQPQSGDYFTAMRANLHALQAALGCTR